MVKKLIKDFQERPAYRICTAVHLFLALGSDFVRPLGNYTAGLMSVAIAGAALGFLVPARFWPNLVQSVRDISLIGVAIFGSLLGAQYISSAGTDVPQRGVAATSVLVLARFQTTVLSLDPSQRTLFTLQDQLRGSDAAARSAAARAALQTENDDTRRGAMEIIFATGDRRLRQIAILRAFKMREGQIVPISQDPQQAETPLSRAFIGASLRVGRVDEAASAFSGGLVREGDQRFMDGTVGADRVVIVSDVFLDSRNVPVTIELHATYDFLLVGTVKSMSGATANIQIALL